MANRTTEHENRFEQGISPFIAAVHDSHFRQGHRNERTNRAFERNETSCHRFCQFSHG